MEFRDLTLRRLQKFVNQRFFSVFDYLRGEHRHSIPCMLWCMPVMTIFILTTNTAAADPLRFMAGLETLASVDYSLCIKAGVHFTLCGGAITHLPVNAKLLAACTCEQALMLTNLQLCSGTIAKLGTEKHHRTFLPRLDTLDLPGCFG
jgi:acyl-CoA oxidase